MKNKIHKIVDSRIKAIEQGYSHPVLLPWRNQSNTWWNESCADVVEIFGLPGGKYTTQINPDLMVFSFKSKKDADLCKILLSEKVL